MNNILLYSRSQSSDPIAAQTAEILLNQLQQTGLHVELTHALNLPRLLLNQYHTVHFIIEDLPLNMNESFHLTFCKALGKSTVLSVLNSEKKPNRDFLSLVMPDAFSVSQTNHLKLYRNVTNTKFIFSGFPKTAAAGKKSPFRHQAYLIPLQTQLEEALNFKLEGDIYYDGRRLLDGQNSAQLRKKWSELQAAKKLTPGSHLVLSDIKMNQLLSEESLSVVLADPRLRHSDFIAWLGAALNKNNMVILNEYQATGFSNYWTSGQNCRVISADNWLRELEETGAPASAMNTAFKPAELLEPTINELSRLYSKLWNQKTSLLTSGSVKL